MDWLLPLKPFGDTMCTIPELPFHVLRHIFQPHHIDSEYRVLLLGPDLRALARILEEVMIETVALEDDDLLQDLAWDCDQTRQASREAGSGRHGPGAADPAIVRLFDLVLTCDLAVHHTNLLSAESLKHTATVLSVLQPGGEFVIVNRHVATGISDDACGHVGRCFVHHFAGYPGACRVAEFGGSTFGRVAWPWRWGRAAEVSYQIVTHRIPQRTIPLGQWLRYGQAEAERHEAACCDEGTVEMRQPAASAFAA